MVQPTVTACGHKIDHQDARPPKNNCVHCWVAYFNMYCDIENLMNQLRDGSFKARHGDKMYKNFRAFVAMQLKKMQDEGANAVSEETQGNPSQEG